MKTAHTPGKWEIERVPIESRGGSNTCFKIGPMKACIYDDWRQRETGISEQENIANARLIAATPELLHACQEMLNEIRAYNGESEFEAGSLVKDWCDMLKLAIAKATGDPKDFAQLAPDVELSPEEGAALKATKPVSWKGNP